MGLLTNEVTKVSASDGGEQFKGKVINFVVNLKSWEEGADPKVDTPVIDQDFPGRYKVTNEQTVEERLALTTADIILRMQAKIDCYKREADLLAHVKFDEAVTAIENGLEG